MKKQTAIILFFLAACQQAQAQTFKDTMIEFKKFEAKTNSGINLPRYVESLASIDYAVNAYNSEADDLNKENKEKFQLALEKYKSAANAWKIYNASRIYGVPKEFSKDSNRYCPKTKYWVIGSEDNFHECISEMWNEATKILTGMKEIKKEEKNEEKINQKQTSKNR